MASSALRGSCSIAEPDPSACKITCYPYGGAGLSHWDQLDVEPGPGPVLGPSAFAVAELVELEPGPELEPGTHFLDCQFCCLLR